MERNQIPYFSKNCSIQSSTGLSLDNDDTIFASIAKTKTTKKKKIHKHFSDCLSNETSSTIFLQPTDKEEIANIISSLNSNKASGPNSIPYRTLFLLKK